MTVKQREQLLRSKRKAAVARFKPKKSERGQLFYVTPKGTRARRGSKGQVYAVYVAKSGRKIPVAPPGLARSLAGLKSHRPATYSLTNTRFKRASAQLASKIKSATVSAGEFRTQPQRGKAAISHEHLVKSSSRGLARAVASLDPRAKRQFVIEGAVTLQFGDKIETEIIRLTEFGAGFGQKLSAADLERYAGARVYGAISEMLSARGLVIKGSAEYVRRLKVNRGKHPRDWKSPVREVAKDGKTKQKLYRWRHADKYVSREFNTGELVEIKRIDWRVKREV